MVSLPLFASYTLLDYSVSAALYKKITKKETISQSGYKVRCILYTVACGFYRYKPFWVMLVVDGSDLLRISYSKVYIVVCGSEVIFGLAFT